MVKKKPFTVELRFDSEDEADMWVAGWLDGGGEQLMGFETDYEKSVESFAGSAGRQRVRYLLEVLMPDITMCDGQDCPWAKDCYRHTATYDTVYQSMFYGSPLRLLLDVLPICDMFWNNKENHAKKPITSRFSYSSLEKRKKK
jgi:hypothetical protein